MIKFLKIHYFIKNTGNKASITLILPVSQIEKMHIYQSCWKHLARFELHYKNMIMDEPIAFVIKSKRFDYLYEFLNKDDPSYQVFCLFEHAIDDIDKYDKELEEEDIKYWNKLKNDLEGTTFNDL